MPPPEKLSQAVRNGAAIRRIRRLVPAGGPGDKVFPPTYPGERNAPVHLFEKRRVDGEERDCVLLDSVQSQANRMELALLEKVIGAGEAWIPHFLTDFSEAEDGDIDLSDIGAITSLEAPHRVFDAIFRDSKLDGTPFWESGDGRRLVKAKPQNATAIFELSPTALVFGSWHSTGQGGGLGAKFPRAIVSEIVGVDAVPGIRAALRSDPLAIRADVKVTGGPLDWQPASGKGRSTKNPSEIGHSNVIARVQREDGTKRSLWEQGVSIDHALQITVLSLPTLRRLRFPVGGQHDDERDAAARCVLAALALLAVTAQDAEGYNLRSRCDLVREGRRPFELLSADGEVMEFELDFTGALALYEAAVEAAKAAGLPWRDAPLRLTPQPKLVRIVAESRRRALAGEAADEGGE